MAVDLQALADRMEIRDLVDAYARHADRVDNEAAAALFTPQGTLRIFDRGKTEPTRERIGREAIAAAFAGLSRYEVTLHVVANHYVELAGDEASGETYCLAHHIHLNDDGSPLDYMMGIRYLDRYRRLDEGWRIELRELQLEFTEDRPVTGP